MASHNNLPPNVGTYGASSPISSKNPGAFQIYPTTQMNPNLTSGVGPQVAPSNNFSENKNNGNGTYSNQNVYMAAGPDANPNNIQSNYGNGTNYNPSGITQNQPAYNPYPIQAPADVQRAVEGERQWKMNSCLDCITKLKGEYERQAFVRKVFGILTAQTLFTVAICAFVYLNKSVEDWLQDNLWFYFVCFGITIGLIITLVCFRKPARKTPINYILLFTFTFFESLMVATASSFYNAESVFLAAVLTFVLFTTITLVSLFTSRKPHTLAMMMYACFSLSLVALIFLIFFSNRYVVLIAMVVLL